MFQVEFNKRANKVTVKTFFSSAAWDLDKILFQLLKPSESTSLLAGFARISFKNRFLVAFRYCDDFKFNVILATRFENLASALMREIETFFQGSNEHDARDPREPVFGEIQAPGTDIWLSNCDRDVFGRKISPRIKARVYRLRKWQRHIRISDAMERNFTFALSELDRMASALSLPKNLRETASKIYRNAVKNHLIRGRSIEGVAAASIYASCRLCKIPRTLQEIAEVARVDKNEIERCYRFISHKLALNAGPTSPVEYISRFASGLKLSGKCQSTARHILQVASKKGLTSGRGPTGVAAAALYLASVLEKERRTQRDIAKIAQVTEVTVRNRFKELISKLNINIAD